MARILVIILLLLAALVMANTTQDRPVWPPPPDEPRLEYIGEITCDDLKADTDILGRLKRFIGGKNADDEISLPFDILVLDEFIYMVCQNTNALIQIKREDNSFRLLRDKDQTITYPISLCSGGSGLIFLTDSESAMVYKLENGILKPFIDSGLVRPTGIAAMPDRKRLYVIDTGEHVLKIFDYKGVLLAMKPDDSTDAMLFPTFATTSSDSTLLINDALNYQVKHYDIDGNLIDAFGSEGDGPGTFSRPKGIGVDSDAHIYVVDNLFDNVQVFDPSGRLLLVVGSRGQLPGQFWSPAGIDIHRDTLFIADTFNNRIQILHYLGEK